MRTPCSSRSTIRDWRRRSSDRKAFFALEDKLRARYLNESGVPVMPATLAEYVARVVPTLERHKRGDCSRQKFEAAYLRSLAFRCGGCRAGRSGVPPEEPVGRRLQAAAGLSVRTIAAECGRLGLAVHLHTMAGAGSYFDVAGANPLNLEPVLDDPALRKRTSSWCTAAGRSRADQARAKPNAYLDFSGQSLLLTPATLAGIIREWLEHQPEKVLFATDAYPYSNELGWEESGWVAADHGREALGRALTAMMRDGEITRPRAVELARMVLRENAKKLYALNGIAAGR